MLQTQTSSRRAWKRRALSLLLAAVMVLGLFPVFPKVQASAHWADPYLSQLMEWGVINQAQAQHPDQALTRADFMAIVNRAYGYETPGETPFEDIKETDWFYDDVGIAYTARYIKGTSPTTASPNSPLTRETATTILGRNMMLQESAGEILDFTDARRISTWAQGTIKSSLEHYLVSGYDDGTFRPQRNVSWGEMASMVTRLIGTPLQEPGDYSLGGTFGNVTITSPGVTLRDTVVSGDLYITGGVGLGGVQLENVTVLGRIIASGTGASEGGASILLRNVTADELLVDNLQDNEVSIRADGITEIGNTTVRTSAYIEDNTPEGLGLHMISLEGRTYPEGEEPEDWEPAKLTLAGRIEEVVNRTPGSTVQVGAGTVAKLRVDEAAVESNVVIDRGAVVNELVLDTGVEVTGEGDIRKLVVNAPDCVVEMLPDEIEIRPGITAEIAGEEMDTVAAKESSEEPIILAGYPQAQDVVPTGLDAAFMTNKSGTVYWAVSAITDGSVGEEDLIKPPSYGSIAVRNGSVKIAKGNEETISKVTGLTPGGSYYLSAVLVDARDHRSPVKVISFTTPDNTKPAFCTGYPKMSTIGTGRKAGDDGKPVYSQVVVMPNKDCKLYYALLPQGATAPTENELKTNAVSGALGYGVRDVKKNTESIFSVHERPLNEQTTYVLYLWLTDADGVNKGKIVSLTFTTADETPPKFIRDPYVDKPYANRVTMKYQIDEAATVYWAAYPVGSVKEFPLRNPSSTSDAVDLKDLYSIQQVVNGVNLGPDGIFGQSKVDRPNSDGAFIGTFDIKNMKPETSYVVWYVAKDKAGADRNYSAEGIQYVIVSPEDKNPSIITQSFSRTVDAGDRTKNPRSNTDIYLDFSEDVYPADNRQQSLQQMGANAAKGNVEAKNLLADALYNAIKMYQLDGDGEGVEVGSIRSTAKGDGAEFAAKPDFVVDYTQAKVSFVNGGKAIRVEFPSSALHLSNGGQYYFAIKDLVDSSGNYLQPDDEFGVNFRYNRDNSVAAKHQAEIFTVEFGGITFSEPTLESMPVDVRKTDGSVVQMTKSVQFRLKPDSTSTVDDLYAYDLVIWNDKADLDSIGYDLYYRVVRMDGSEEVPLYYGEQKDGVTTYKYYKDANYGNSDPNAPEITNYLINKPNGQTETGTPAEQTASLSTISFSSGGGATGAELDAKVGTVDKDGWIYLGRTKQNVTPSEGNRRGRSLNMSFNGCTNFNDFPKLNTLNENLRYDFVIAVNYYNGSSDASTWDGWARFYINLAAGQAPKLLNIGSRPDFQTTWKPLKEKDLAGGVRSVGYWPEAKAGQDAYEMMRECHLSPSGLPAFLQGSPEFVPTADSVTINAGLTVTNTPGRIYYAISKKQENGTSTLPAYRAVMKTDLDQAGNIKGIQYTDGTYEGAFVGNEALDVGRRLMYVSKGGSQEPPTGGVKPGGSLLAWMRGGGPNSTQDVVAGENLLVWPDNEFIASRPTSDVVAAGDFKPGLGVIEGYTVPGKLDSDTDYFVYLVIGLEGDQENLSHVYMYQFHTQRPMLPRVSLSGETQTKEENKIKYDYKTGNIIMTIDTVTEGRYRIFTEEEVNDPGKTYFKFLREPFKDWTKMEKGEVEGDLPDIYKKNDAGEDMTVMDALMKEYSFLAATGTGKPQEGVYYPNDYLNDPDDDKVLDGYYDYDTGYHVFDMYASNEAKLALYNLIVRTPPKPIEDRPETKITAERGKTLTNDPNDPKNPKRDQGLADTTLNCGESLNDNRYVAFSYSINPQMKNTDLDDNRPENTYQIAAFSALNFDKGKVGAPQPKHVEGRMEKKDGIYTGNVTIVFDNTTYLPDGSALASASGTHLFTAGDGYGLGSVTYPSVTKTIMPGAASGTSFTLNFAGAMATEEVVFPGSYFRDNAGNTRDVRLRVYIDNSGTQEYVVVTWDGEVVKDKIPISEGGGRVLNITGDVEGTTSLVTNLDLKETDKSKAELTAQISQTGGLNKDTIEYRWEILSGSDVISISPTTTSTDGKVTVTGLRPGVASIMASGSAQKTSGGARENFQPRTVTVIVKGAVDTLAADDKEFTLEIGDSKTVNITANIKPISDTAEIVKPTLGNKVSLTIDKSSVTITSTKNTQDGDVVTIPIRLVAKDSSGTDLTPDADDRQSIKVTFKAKTPPPGTRTNAPARTPTLTLSGGGLSGSTLSVKASQSVTVKATASSGTVSWTSADTSIATVTQSGVITGKAIGTTTVTASINGTSVRKDITVNVKGQVSGLTMTSSSSAQWDSGAKTLTLTRGSTPPPTATFSVQAANGAAISNKTALVTCSVPKDQRNYISCTVDPTTNKITVKPGNSTPAASTTITVTVAIVTQDGGVSLTDTSDKLTFKIQIKGNDSNTSIGVLPSM